MTLIENRVVGENAFENAVLQNYVQDMLTFLYEAESLCSWGAGDTGEPGVMWAEADWYHGSLACEVWFEPLPHEGEPSAETWESGAFHLQLKWRTPGREGEWYEVYDIVQALPGDEEVGPEFDDVEAHLKVGEEFGGLRLVTA